MKSLLIGARVMTAITMFGFGVVNVPTLAADAPTASAAKGDAAADSGATVLVGTIPEPIQAAKLGQPTTAPTTEPAVLTKIDAIDPPDAVRLIGPSSLQGVDLAESGTTVKIGRLSGGLGNIVKPVVEISIHGDRLMWEWKCVVDNDGPDEKLSDWLRFSELQLLKGDQILAVVQFCPIEEVSVLLKAPKPQRLRIAVDPALLYMSSPLPVPVGWDATRSSHGTVFNRTDNASVRFAVEFDPGSASVSATWKKGFDYMNTRAADTLLDCERLKSELLDVQQQEAAIRPRLTGAYSDSQERLRSQYQQLQAQENALPREIASKQQQAAGWHDRAAAFDTLQPFEASLSIKANGVVLYHFKFDPGVTP